MSETESYRSRDPESSHPTAGPGMPCAPSVPAGPSHSGPLTADGVLYPVPVLQDADHGPLVHAWQTWLVTQGLRLDDASGTYEELTTLATQAWQATHGLTPTGRVDAPTWAQVGAVVLGLLSWAVRSLDLGARGPAVEAWREYLDLPPSEVYGADLEDAVAEWQDTHGLPATGRVAAADWAAVGLAAVRAGDPLQ